MGDDLEQRLMFNLAKTHDRTVSEREQGAHLALRCGNGMATEYWRALARTARRTLNASTRSKADD